MNVKVMFIAILGSTTIMAALGSNMVGSSNKDYFLSREDSPVKVLQNSAIS
jgi:hypothetical protein